MDTPAISLRPATRADIPQILAFIAGLAEYEPALLAHYREVMRQRLGLASWQAGDGELLSALLGLLASVGLIALANPSGLSKSVAARFTVQPTSSIDTALAWLKSNLLSKKLVKRTSIQEEQDLLNQLAELAEQVAFCLDAGCRSCNCRDQVGTGGVAYRPR